jgi:hypothetical protein
MPSIVISASPQMCCLSHAMRSECLINDGGAVMWWDVIDTIIYDNFFYDVIYIMLFNVVWKWFDMIILLIIVFHHYSYQWTSMHTNFHFSLMHTNLCSTLHLSESSMMVLYSTASCLVISTFVHIMFIVHVNMIVSNYWSPSLTWLLKMIMRKKKRMQGSA